MGVARHLSGPFPPCGGRSGWGARQLDLCADDRRMRRMDLLHVLPFVAMLLGIALLPIAAPHLWEHPAGPIGLTVVCSIPTIVGAVAAGELHGIAEGLGDYVAFIALIAALYVTAGGIRISGHPRGTPLVNGSLLAIGAGAASLIGTTGASMLLVRPLLD